MYRSASFSPVGANHDTISGFVASGAGHDRIDVSLMDADVTNAGRQHFAFIGTDTFAHYRSTHPGAVGMLRFDVASRTLQGNVNADFANAEFVVGLPGVSTFTAGDLILA